MSIKLMNQGTFGCIYRPGITCSGKLEKHKFITKIQKSVDSINNELNVSKHIRRIPGFHRFFAPIMTSCPVNVSKKYSDEIANGCLLFDKNNAPSNYVSNKIRYVGTNNLLQHIHLQTTTVTFWKEILETHKYLTKGIQKLLSANIIHFDIKYNNIMYDDHLNVPIFIDFGLSIHLPSMTEKNANFYFYVFNTYNYWCIDVEICNYIFHYLGIESAKTNLVSMNDIDFIVNIFIKGKPDSKGVQSKNDVFDTYIFNRSNLGQSFTNNCRKYFGKFIGKPWIDVYNHFMELQTYKSWDNYALCVTYIFILEDYAVKHPDIYQRIRNNTEHIYNKYLNYLQSVLFAMPDDRPGCDNTIQIIQQLSRELKQ